MTLTTYHNLLQHYNYNYVTTYTTIFKYFIISIIVCIIIDFIIDIINFRKFAKANYNINIKVIDFTKELLKYDLIYKKRQVF